MKIELFEAPMCCATGLCGPSVNERLILLNEDLKHLQVEEPALTVERFALNQQPLKFHENKEVYALITANGKKILPITIINGEVIKTGSYPSYWEIKLKLKAATIDQK